LFYFLSNASSKKWFAGAVVMGVILPYSNGNGVYILVLAGIFLLLVGNLQRAMPWGLLVVVIGCSFYWGMPTAIGLAGYSGEELSIVKKCKTV
jgi:hypothetical protein